MKREEKCCGECCWFYGEDTYGYGFCAEAKGEAWGDSVRCDQKCKFSRGGCDNPCFVSQAQMRHHMAVLLQRLRFQQDDSGYSFKRKRKYPFGVLEAMEFAYRYMKVFSKL